MRCWSLNIVIINILYILFTYKIRVSLIDFCISVGNRYAMVCIDDERNVHVENEDAPIYILSLLCKIYTHVLLYWCLPISVWADLSY